MLPRVISACQVKPTSKLEAATGMFLQHFGLRLMNKTEFPMATDIDAIEWLNTPQPLSINTLKGKVIAIHAFQMLCPGCVSHGIPQASAMHELFSNDDLQVIGLHSVFEHHDVMTVNALKAFIHEYRLWFPIAVDEPSDNHPIPKTMQKYQLRGTPSLILIDRRGHIRAHEFGRVNDMLVGRLIGELLSEPSAPVEIACGEDGCLIPP